MKQLKAISLLFIILLLATLSACTGVGTDRAGDLAINDGVDKPQPAHGTSSYEGILSDSRPLLDESDVQLGRVVFWAEDGMLYGEFKADGYYGVENVQLCVSKTPPTDEQPGEFPYFDEPTYNLELSEPITPVTVAPVGALSIQPAPQYVVQGPIAPVNMVEMTRTSDDVQGNGIDDCTASVSLVGFPAGGQVYVAASANIRVDLPSGSYTVKTWARDAAAGSDWYFSYPRTPNSNLPSGNVSFIALSGAGSTWSSTLQGIPAGYDVQSGYAYNGWCVDLGHHLNTNHGYFTELYSSYSPDLPDYCRDNDWDMVNYIINHKQGNRAEIQAAIWYFIGGGEYPPAGPARDMADAALEHGEGYVPDIDDVLAIVVPISPDAQNTIIETDVDHPVM